MLCKLNEIEEINWHKIKRLKFIKLIYSAFYACHYFMRDSLITKDIDKLSRHKNVG